MSVTLLGPQNARPNLKATLDRLGISGPDVSDNALGDVVYTTGRHTAPLQAGDTVFAAGRLVDSGSMINKSSSSYYNNNRIIY